VSLAFKRGNEYIVIAIHARATLEFDQSYHLYPREESQAAVSSTGSSFCAACGGVSSAPIPPWHRRSKRQQLVPVDWMEPRLYYQSYKPLDEDLPWIDILLKQDGPTHEDVREALSFRCRTVMGALHPRRCVSIYNSAAAGPGGQNTIGKPHDISATRTTSGNRYGNCSRRRCEKCSPGTSVSYHRPQHGLL